MVCDAITSFLWCYDEVIEPLSPLHRAVCSALFAPASVRSSHFAAAALPPSSPRLRSLPGGCSRPPVRPRSRSHRPGVTIGHPGFPTTTPSSRRSSVACRPTAHSPPPSAYSRTTDRLSECPGAVSCSPADGIWSTKFVDVAICRHCVRQLRFTDVSIAYRPVAPVTHLHYLTTQQHPLRRRRRSMAPGVQS